MKSSTFAAVLIWMVMALTMPLLLACADSKNEPQPVDPQNPGDLLYEVISESDRTVKVKKIVGWGKKDIIVPQSVVLDGVTYTVTEIGSLAFTWDDGKLENTNLESVKLPNTIEYISYRAFENCTNLKKVSLSFALRTIGTGAFEGCASLEAIELPQSLQVIENYTFSGCTSLKNVTFPPTLAKIGNSAFSGCTSLENVTFPPTLAKIGNSAFKECSKMTYVSIPNSVLEIDQNAFRDCKSLTSVTIGTGLLKLDSYAFGGCEKLRKVTLLPNTPPANWTRAFEYSTYCLFYVANNDYVGGNIKVYPFLSSYFDENGLRYVPVSPSERTCAIIDCLYDTTAKIIIGEKVRHDGMELEIVEINPNLLANNHTVSSLSYNSDFPIPYGFASGCENLTTVKLSDDISFIGADAFRECNSLNALSLPANLIHISSAAFYKSGLTSITIPSGTEKIDNAAFSECPNLEAVTISDGDCVLSVGYNSIGSEKPMFAGTKLKQVYIGRHVLYSTDKNNGYSPFYRNTTLQKVTMSDNPQEVFTNEFYGCTSLKDVSIGDGVIVIGDYAFSGCASIESFSFGASVVRIGVEAFSDCTAMTKLYAEPSTPPSCGNQALDDINKWNCTLYVPASAKDSYQSASQWKEFFKIESHKF